MVVELPGQELVAGGRDGVGPLLVEDSQFMVCQGGRLLDIG
jgi:hypothetical protein